MSNSVADNLFMLNTIIKQKKQKLMQMQEEYDRAVEDWYYAALLYCPVKIGDIIYIDENDRQDAVFIGLEPDDETGMPVLRMRKLKDNDKDELFVQIIKVPLWEWLEGYAK